jgi:hypothetical protein
MCSKCGETKDETSDFHFDSRTQTARSWCKLCTNADNLARAKANPAQYTARSKAWREANPERAAAVALAWYHRNQPRARANYMRSRFKIDWKLMWEAQKGLCACCGKPMLSTGREKSSAVVDHDHSCCPGKKSCGKCVRGLIHWSCNVLLGYAKHDPQILRYAADYMERHRRSKTSAPEFVVEEG